MKPNLLRLASFQQYRLQVEGYGFRYIPAQQILRFLVCFVCILLFALYFQMHAGMLLFLCLLLAVLLPMWFLWQYEYLYEEKLFKEFTMVVQQMASSFKINPKIAAVCKEVRIFCHGDLQAQLDQCLWQMEQGNSLELALQSLRQRYSFFVLHNLLTLMCAVEEYGARQFQEGLDLIQDDLDDVIEDTYLNQQEMMQIKGRVYVLNLLALVIGMLSKQMLGELFFFQEHLLYQGSLFFFTLTLIGSMLVVQLAMRHTWIIWEKNHEI